MQGRSYHFPCDPQSAPPACPHHVLLHKDLTFIPFIEACAQSISFHRVLNKKTRSAKFVVRPYEVLGLSVPVLLDNNGFEEDLQKQLRCAVAALHHGNTVTVTITVFVKKPKKHFYLPDEVTLLDRYFIYIKLMDEVSTTSECGSCIVVDIPPQQYLDSLRQPTTEKKPLHEMWVKHFMDVHSHVNGFLDVVDSVTVCSMDGCTDVKLLTDTERTVHIAVHIS